MSTMPLEDQLRKARMEFARELDRYSIRVLLYVRGTGERPTGADLRGFELAYDKYTRALKEAVDG